MRNLSTLGSGLLWVAMLFVGGCHSPLDAPAAWRSVSADEYVSVHAFDPSQTVRGKAAATGTATITGRSAAPATALTPPASLSPASISPPIAPAPHRMQVLICYDSVSSSHAAIRLISPATMLFWDPGGLLGHEGNGGFVRVNSIIEGRPTLDEYWAWRQSFTELAMQVFEYDLSQAEHVALFDVLDSCRTKMREDGFTTNWMGGQCCVGTSQFLRRYFHGRLTVSHEYFWPHSLACELWTQPVNRVYDYRRGHEKCRVLSPP